MITKVHITLTYRGFKEEETRKILEEKYKALKVNEVGKDYVIISVYDEMLVRIFFGNSLAVIDAIVTERGFTSLLCLLNQLYNYGLVVASFNVEVSAH